MNARLEVLITFILYLCFFGWIGWRRGFRSELVVFIASVGTWLLLQRAGDLFVRLANLGGKFVTFVKAGGLSANPDPAFAALKEAPLWVTDENKAGFLFLIWIFIVLVAYIVSTMAKLEPKKNERTGGWAVLLGMANGLFFTSIFLPRLVALVVPQGADFNALVERANILGLLSSSVRLLIENLSAFWTLVRPQASIVLVILLTLFLVLVASTLRTGHRTRTNSQQNRDGRQNREGNPV